jgi:hypothetical protein
MRESLAWLVHNHFQHYLRRRSPQGDADGLTLVSLRFHAQQPTRHSSLDGSTPLLSSSPVHGANAGFLMRYR